MKFIYILLFLAVLNLNIDAEEKKKAPAFHMPSAYSDLCDETNLYGVWKVVRWIPYFTVKGKMWNTPPFMKNQWLDFNGKGGMKFLASNMEMKLDDVQRKLSEADYQIKIEFKKKGFLTVKPQKKGMKPQTWRCSVMKKDIKMNEMMVNLKKGDLIMTHLGEDNTILYFRQLRRVEEKGDKN